MVGHMRIRMLATAVSVLAALAFAGASGASDEPTAAQGCVEKNNLEAIVDDSGSMTRTDPTLLRVRALEQFVDTPDNAKRTLGAIEFGTDAADLFAPALIGQSRANMKSVLNQRVFGNNGNTDYNDAFSFAGTHNPNATGRIFLTDGEHVDPVPYGNTHQGGPPVYVLGLGAGSPGGPSETLLQQIATDTGGFYRRADTPTQLQSAMFDVSAAVGCLAAPIKFTDKFTRLNQRKARSVRVPGGIRSAQFNLSWASGVDAFDIFGFRVVRRGKTVARGTAVRKLKVTRRTGETFLSVKVSRLVRGKLRFRLRATRLSSSSSGVELTTQLVRSRRR